MFSKKKDHHGKGHDQDGDFGISKMFRGQMAWLVREKTGCSATTAIAAANEVWQRHSADLITVETCFAMIDEACDIVRRNG
jgi:hypothetical protein